MKNVGVKTNGFPVELDLKLLNLDTVFTHTEKVKTRSQVFFIPYWLVGSALAEHASTSSRQPEAFRAREKKTSVARKSLSVV